MKTETETAYTTRGKCCRNSQADEKFMFYLKNSAETFYLAKSASNMAVLESPGPKTDHPENSGIREGRLSLQTFGLK